MINKNTNPLMGYLSISLCCLTSAISFVFIAHLNKTHDQMLSIAITFSYAIVLFKLFNIKKINSIYSAVIKNFKLIFSMNIMTLFNWGTTFIAFSCIDPATSVCINLSVLTITLFLILKPLEKIKENKHLVFSILLIVISMVLIINQYSVTSLHINNKVMLVGMIASVIGGISGAFIGINSEGMGKAGFSVTQILSTRFYLLIIVSSVAFYFVPHSAPITIDWNYYLLSSLIIVIFPLLMYQTAIKNLGAMIVSLLEPFTPVLTYILQVFVGDNQFNFFTVLLLIFSSSAVIWFVRIEQNIIREKNLSSQENALEQAVNTL